MKRRLLYWIPVIIYYGLITVLSNLPMAAFPEEFAFFKHFDKLVHFVIYFFFGVLSLRALMCGRREEKGRWLLLFYTFCLASVAGVIDEIHQTFIPGRELDYFDMLADVLGAVTGAWAYHFGFARLKEKIVGRHKGCCS